MKIKRALIVLGYVVVMYVGVALIRYHFVHDELTSMQVIKQTWEAVMWR